MRLFILFFCLTAVRLFGQQVSYEFKSAVPPDGEIVMTIDQSYYGTYRNEQTGTELTIDERGITMTTIIVSFISKEQVRESSKYDVRNGYLFGVKENDSVPCILEGENYYFGVRQEVNLRDEKHQAIIKRTGERSYVLNFLETNGYSPSMLKISGNTVSIEHFTYPSDQPVFKGIKNMEYKGGSDYQLCLLQPTQLEWNALDKTLIFDKAILFVKK